MKLIIINGPNLNLLGRRKPEVYGSDSFDCVLDRIRIDFPDTEYFQSNSEGEIIDTLHKFGFDPEVVGIIVNPGAYTHYSYAIADAIEAIERPVVEVHISNIFAREQFRHTSVTARHCRGSIAGFGLDGYLLAAMSLMKI